MADRMKIAVVAPASRVAPETAEKTRALAARIYGETGPEIHFHPQCFLSDGHFAGSDAARSAAFLEAANDPGFDAVWFGRGGYGSCRLDETLYGKLNGAAREKTYLGYSDLGVVLARLYREGIGRPVHGPMPSDVNRPGGEAALARALKFLVENDVGALEPVARGGQKVLAFNIAVLSSILGTAHEPDFSGHVLMLEEVSEYMYRIDRALFHVTSNANVRRAAGIMLGRCSDIPENEVDFGKPEEEVCRHWCARAGIAYLGRADIGHDADNKIVPFGALRPALS